MQQLLGKLSLSLLIGLGVLGLVLEYRSGQPDEASDRPSARHAPHLAQSRSALRDLVGCEASRPAETVADNPRKIGDPGDEMVGSSESELARPTSQRNRKTQTLGDGFVVNVSAEDAELPLDVEKAIRVAARRHYTQWRSWLGMSEVAQTQINMRFLGDAESFASIYGKPDREGWITTGFYRVRNNEALVLYTPAYRNTAVATAFHEMSHLITARHLGPTPPWLNEGLAEYFETMRLRPNSTDFATNRAHLRLLRERGPVALGELTRLSRSEWAGDEPLRRYASAWSLIAFLFDSPEGRGTLRKVMQSAHAQRCAAHTDLYDALSSYPGGTAHLEARWRRWVRSV